MEMATFRISTKDWLRTTTAAMRAKLTRSEFVRRAVLAAIDQQTNKIGGGQ